MRILITVALVFCAVASLQVQQKKAQPQPRTNPALPCGERSPGLPDFYYEAVLARIKEPGWQDSLIRIVVGAGMGLVLRTDGEKFELWTDTPEIPQNDIAEFLLNLDQSCRLPADPADAVALLKVKWERKEISSAQFAQLHNSFTQALSEYVSKIQGRYGSLIATRLSASYVDAGQYSIVYDNAYEHIESKAWDVPEHGIVNPMVKWVYELHKLAEDSFHRPFGNNSSR